MLDLPGHRLRVRAPDVGGGFGAKVSLYPEEVLVALLARRLGRPVKWMSDRREDLMSTTQAFDEIVRAELGLDGNGAIVGLRAEIVGDVGAYSVYPWTAAVEPVQVASFLSGPYRVPDYRARVRAVATPKPPTGAYRGVGRPPARVRDGKAPRHGRPPARGWTPGTCAGATSSATGSSLPGALRPGMGPGRVHRLPGTGLRGHRIRRTARSPGRRPRGGPSARHRACFLRRADRGRLAHRGRARYAHQYGDGERRHPHRLDRRGDRGLRRRLPGPGAGNHLGAGGGGGAGRAARGRRESCTGTARRLRTPPEPTRAAAPSRPAGRRSCARGRCARGSSRPLRT